MADDRFDWTGVDLALELDSTAGMIEAQGPHGYDANFTPHEAAMLRQAAAELRRLRSELADRERRSRDLFAMLPKAGPAPGGHCGADDEGRHCSRRDCPQERDGQPSAPEWRDCPLPYPAPGGLAGDLAAIDGGEA